MWNLIHTAHQINFTMWRTFRPATDQQYKNSKLTTLAILLQLELSHAWIVCFRLDLACEGGVLLWRIVWNIMLLCWICCIVYNLTDYLLPTSHHMIQVSAQRHSARMHIFNHHHRKPNTATKFKNGRVNTVQPGANWPSNNKDKENI